MHEQIFKDMIKNDFFSSCLAYVLWKFTKNAKKLKSAFFSGNGMEPSANKPLPESLSTKVHMVRLSHNKLSIKSCCTLTYKIMKPRMVVDLNPLRNRISSFTVYFILTVFLWQFSVTHISHSYMCRNRLTIIIPYIITYIFIIRMPPRHIIVISCVIQEDRSMRGSHYFCPEISVP